MNLPAKADLTSAQQAQIEQAIAQIVRLKRRIAVASSRKTGELITEKGACFKTIASVVGFGCYDSRRHNMTVDWLDENYPGWRGYPDPAVFIPTRNVA